MISHNKLSINFLHFDREKMLSTFQTGKGRQTRGINLNSMFFCMRLMLEEMKLKISPCLTTSQSYGIFSPGVYFDLE